MKAISLRQPGGVENLVEIDIPTPAIHDDEVLVNVQAISINPVDAFVRANAKALKHVINPTEGEPIILGWDIAGTITEIGKDVSTFNIGEAVFGMVNFPGPGRAYAEYIAAPAAQLAIKPANISFTDAAAATLAALTAYQSLVTFANVKKGDKVLIHSAAGGVGHYAVQLAKHLGAYVIGTGSAESQAFIRELGADEFIDYKNQVFEKEVTDADVVLDSVGNDPAHIDRSLQALKTGGRLISLLTFFDDRFQDKLNAKQVYGHRLEVESNGDDMNVIAGLLASGALQSHVSKVFSFDEIQQAHRAIETKKQKANW